MRLDFGDMPLPVPGLGYRRGLRLAAAPSGMRGPEKYRILEVRRRRAQMRARRVLGLV